MVFHYSYCIFILLSTWRCVLPSIGASPIFLWAFRGFALRLPALRVLQARASVWYCSLSSNGCQRIGAVQLEDDFAYHCPAFGRLSDALQVMERRREVLKLVTMPIRNIATFHEMHSGIFMVLYFSIWLHRSLLFPAQTPLILSRTLGRQQVGSRSPWHGKFMLSQDLHYGIVSFIWLHWSLFF